MRHQSSWSLGPYRPRSDGATGGHRECEGLDSTQQEAVGLGLRGVRLGPCLDLLTLGGGCGAVSH